MGVVREDEIRKILATKLGIPFVNLKKFNINPGVIEIVPENIVRQHNIMPLCFYDKKLIVAIENPMNHWVLDYLRFQTNIYIEPVIADKQDIEWAIIHHYGGHIDLLAQALDDGQFGEANNVPEIDESDSALGKVVNKMILDTDSADMVYVRMTGQNFINTILLKRTHTLPKCGFNNLWYG